MKTRNPKKQIRASRIGILIVILTMALLATACGGTTGSNTPTATTVIGFVPPEQQTVTMAPEGTMAEPAQTAAPTVEPAGTSGPMDACSLASSEEVSPVLGQAPLAATPGSDPDSISGSTIYFCTYLGSNGLAVVISTVDTGTAEAGKAMVQSQLNLATGNDPGMVVTEASGVGDQAYWSYGEKAASYTVLKGTHVFSVALGGAIGDPSSHQAALLTLTQTVAGRE